jgi:hypothetical protein
MMNGFSPLTRRIVALGIFVLLLLLAINLAGQISAGLSDRLDALQQSRFRLARLEAVRARPAARAVAVSNAPTFRAASHADAAEQATAAVNAAAAVSQLQSPSISVLPQDLSNPALLQLSIAASAPEPVILAFVSELERGTPAIRLGNWSIDGGGTGAAGATLQAVALAAWGGPQ